MRFYWDWSALSVFWILLQLLDFRHVFFCHDIIPTTTLSSLYICPFNILLLFFLLLLMFSLFQLHYRLLLTVFEQWFCSTPDVSRNRHRLSWLYIHLRLASYIMIYGFISSYRQFSWFPSLLGFSCRNWFWHNYFVLQRYEINISFQMPSIWQYPCIISLIAVICPKLSLQVFFSS